MHTRTRKWTDWRQHVASRCDLLTRELAPPIPLHRISRACHIKEVVFQPLLVEAGLAVDPDGFVVYVNAGAESEKEMQSAFDGTDREERRLSGRARFSLAHELVHTFFYDTSKRPYANRLPGTKAKEIDSLESACNFGASLLLLPTRLLKADTGKLDVMSIEGIDALTGKYHVSLECLINRLEHLEDWTPKRGLICLVRAHGDSFRLRAIAKSASVRGLFKDAIRDGDFKTVFGRTPLEALLRQTRGGMNFDLRYQGPSGSRCAPCFMEYRRVSASPETFLVVLNVGEPFSVKTERKSSAKTTVYLESLRKALGQSPEGKSVKR